MCLFDKYTKRICRRQRILLFFDFGLLEFYANGLSRKRGYVCGYICIYVYTWSMVKKCLRSINTSKPHESPNHVYMEINVRGRYICLNTYVLYTRAKITHKKSAPFKVHLFYYYLLYFFTNSAINSLTFKSLSIPINTISSYKLPH